jgi:1,4-alpha-glucan branching enzyme
MIAIALRNCNLVSPARTEVPERPQYRQCRLVLLRPNDRRIRKRNLERPIRADKLSRGQEIVMGEEWRARDQDLDAISAARNSDPFGVLGPHRSAAGWVVRVFAPEAISVRALTRDGALMAELPRRGGDFFEALIPSAIERPAYRIEVATAHGAYSYIDPYAFRPALGPLDDYLAREGTHRQLYRRLGAQLIRREGVDGVLFAVWAPNATRVSVVGEFNRWDGRRCQMRRRFDSGLWEIFVPQLTVGAVYKFELLGPNGALLPLKADPFGFEAELRPSTASVVADSADFSWTDAEYMAKRGEGEPRRKPMSIYEVHLGSWRRGEGGRFLTYDELADQLIPYVADLGYTHLELLPISEHPLDESWGYQPIGLFAPTRRFGDPAAFARFVDRAHAAGLAVICKLYLELNEKAEDDATKSSKIPNRPFSRRSISSTLRLFWTRMHQ